MRRSRVLIRDEPTASLSDAEIERVFETVRWLRNSGTAVVYISHRLPEIFALTDRITVFRNGRRVLTKDTPDWTSAELVREMIGREVEEGARTGVAHADGTSETAVEYVDFAVPGRVSPTSLRVARSEIVGIIGQLGCGAATLVEALAGLERSYVGAVHVHGREVALHSQACSLRAGISYVTEDRGAKSLFKGASVQQNLTSADLARFTRWGVVNRKAACEASVALAKRFQIDPRRMPSDVSTLSGGNQQKVAIAKSVACRPTILVLNEPTRGVDVGARAEI